MLKKNLPDILGFSHEIACGDLTWNSMWAAYKSAHSTTVKSFSVTLFIQNLTKH